MSLLPPVLIQEIRKYLAIPELEIRVSPLWGATAPDSKLLLRTDLQKHQSDGFVSSVSHAPELGGYVLRKGPVGFDIEAIKRVTPAVVARVSDDAEVRMAPSSAALWCAKEAAFKSMRGPLQPQLISQMQIHSWRQESHFETFQFGLRQDSEGLKTFGLSFRKGVHQFAIAGFSS